MHHGVMTAPPNPAGCLAHPILSQRNPLSSKKLLHSKWTAVAPANKEKHFVVTRVVAPDPPAVNAQWVEVEAVRSGRATLMQWRDLTDREQWRQGWV